ncbi:gfo/Idh/MocA family oxidoreductase [Actinobacteria bacterium YIM 96077]|uniref:Gfo/Idh/MocA family oxidoreductase n=1 Tax=Phytoactinopolyspora halophila TaxID=1981511 RepID=A0A329QR10_9ACTN|nr:Gfo/Idh/MocA family oxidoreductase [Phytoactinopolyspora halophila]AYY12281.1 gfo/Idh/MocA family oxidoreductase [Actinobacteria bacterium YIM 96077]RAW13802.1 gfo/Idh/MocA family oxidoreductase [Phytoactinopolyspora halophila]
MQRVNVGIIGTGWCGGIRARTAARNALVEQLHLCDTSPERLAEVAAETGAASAVADYHEILADARIHAVMISATPETTHYPMARDALDAGKDVLLEKPLALTLGEADDLVARAQERDCTFTIGYSQRFNTKQALVKRSMDDGTLGIPVSGLVSRHITRKLGDKIGGRITLSPAAMEATHDIDFLLWCMEPAVPVRVYAQAVERVMKDKYGISDCMSIVVTLDNGVVLTIGAGWILPPGYPNFSSTWIEIVGSEGALILDDTHRDTMLNTMSGGLSLPLSTMPGEEVGHVYAGPMRDETNHFIEAVAYDRPVLVTPEQARQTMEVYLAADISAATNQAVELPLDSSQEAHALELAGISA